MALSVIQTYYHQHSAQITQIKLRSDTSCVKSNQQPLAKSSYVSYNRFYKLRFFIFIY